MAKTKTDRPKFSREMAFVWLDGIDDQFSNIASIAIGGLRYEETRIEDCKDPVMRGLLRVIQQQADDSVHVCDELRAMARNAAEGGKAWLRQGLRISNRGSLRQKGTLTEKQPTL